MPEGLWEFEMRAPDGFCLKGQFTSVDEKDEELICGAGRFFLRELKKLSLPEYELTLRQGPSEKKYSQCWIKGFENMFVILEVVE